MGASKVSLYQARSAGAAAKPKKSENVLELVQFFQTYDEPQLDQLSAEPQGAGPREIFKAGQRRLRQLAQRQKRDSYSKSKPDDSSIQVTTRPRGGVFSASKLKASFLEQDSGPTLSHSKSLDSMRTIFKSEVENIGQPWLEDVAEKKNAQEEEKQRAAPLALREFTSVINIAEPRHLNSDDEVPPPYQQLTHPGLSSDGHSTAQKLSIIEEAPNPTEKHLQKSNGPGSSASDPAGTDKSSDKTDSGIAVTISQSGEASGAKPSSATLVVEGNSHNATAIQCARGRQRGGSNPETNYQKSKNEAAAAKVRVSVCSPSNRSFSQPLKLFPDALPPRSSSRCAVTASSVMASAVMATSKASKPSASSSSTGKGVKESSSSATETNKRSPKTSSNRSQNIDPIPRPHSSAQTPLSQVSEQDARSTGNVSNKSSKSAGKTGGHRTSLPLQAMLASPLSVPANCDPAAPKSKPADAGRRCGKDNANGLVSLANATSREILQPPWVSPSRQKPSTLVCARTVVPTSVVSFEAAPSKEHEADRQDKSSRAAVNERHHDREGRIRAPMLKDGSRLHLDAGKPHVEGLAQSTASPATPQAAPKSRNRESPVFHKRSPALDAEIDRRTPRSVVTEFPTPPPRSPLPSDPPVQAHAGDSFGRRYLNSLNNLPMAPVSHHKTASQQVCGSPRICRNHSTRSAIVFREAIPSTRNDSDFSESPIPSSDDEGPDTALASPLRDRRRRAHAARKRVDAAAPRLARHAGKEDHFNSTRLLMPGNQNCRDAWTSPPQSPHSGCTHRSQDSQASYASSAASVVHSLEVRVAHLEQQNRVLQAALMATMDISGKLQTSSLLNDLTASFSGPTSMNGRSVSSLASYSSGVDESVSRVKNGTDDVTKSPCCCHSWQASRDNISLSSFETSSRKRDFSNVKEPGCMKEDIKHGWLPTVEVARTIKSS